MSAAGGAGIRSTAKRSFALEDDEFDAAVFSAVCTRDIRRERARETIAPRHKPRFIHTIPNKPRAHRIRPLLAEAEVQVGSAAIVRMPLDLEELDLGVTKDHIGDLKKERIARFEDLGAIGREVDLAADRNPLAAKLGEGALRAADERDLLLRRLIRLHLEFIRFDEEFIRLD